MSKMKSNSVIGTEIINTETDKRIVFTVAGVAQLELSLSSVSSQVFERAAIHGLIQRICDTAAISRNTETGQSATPAEKYEAMKELVDYYNSGAVEWSRKRTGTGSGDSGGLLRKCLLKMYPEKGAQRIDEFLKGLSRKEKLALLNSEQVKVVADEFRVKETDKEAAEELLKGL